MYCPALGLTWCKIWYPISPFTLYWLSPPPSILWGLSVVWSGVSISKGSLWGPTHDPPHSPTSLKKSTAIKQRSHRHTLVHTSPVRWLWGPVVLLCTYVAMVGNQYVCTGVSNNRFLVNDGTELIHFNCYYYPDLYTLYTFQTETWSSVSSCVTSPWRTTATNICFLNLLTSHLQ